MRVQHHESAKAAAESSGIPLTRWVEEAVEEKLARERCPLMSKEQGLAVKFPHLVGKWKPAKPRPRPKADPPPFANSTTPPEPKHATETDWIYKDVCGGVVHL